MFLGCLIAVASNGKYTIFFFWSASPQVGQGLLIHEVSRSHTTMHQSVGLLWTSDQLVAETSTWQHTTLTTDRRPCPPPVGFEPTVLAGEQPQTYALDRAATGIGKYTKYI